VVQPGVRNLAISEAAAQYGLYYAPDPSSQIACTIGGNVAENSGGVHCLKYGLTVHNVLRVRVATIDGEIIELGSEALDAPGLDLLAVFIGSEGMLGIVTEVTVKLVPKPAVAQVIMASFDDVVTGGNAVASVIAAGIIPAGLEMMDRTSSRMVEPFVHAGYDTDAAAILLCEADGTPLEVAEEIERMTAVLQGAGASAIAVSQNEAERMRFWSGRKNAFPAAGRISPDYYCMDGTIPRKHLAQVLTGIEQMERTYGLRCANVFHAGDGNLHPLILFDANSRANSSAPKPSAPRSWRCAWKWAAPSPASTASAWRRSIRCACSSRARSSTPSSPSSAPSTRRCCSIPTRRSRPCTAAPNSARCTCTRARAAVPRPAALLSCPLSDPCMIRTIQGPGPRPRPPTRRALRIRGGGTKDWYGRRCEGEILDTRATPASSTTSRPNW
jgi:hypothetical protein